MKKTLEFLKANKLAVIWTIYYVAALYCILIFLFGFDLFSLYQWRILLNSKLHGFVGFTFGLIMYSALPLYLATTAIIIRTKKPLFELNLFKKKEVEKKEEKEEKKPEEEIVDLPDRIPTELKGPFLRVRQKINFRPESTFDIKDINIKKDEPNLQHSQEPSLPLPDSFDFMATENFDDTNKSSVPVFKEINFSEFNNNVSGQTNIFHESELLKYLKGKNYEPVMDGNIVIAKNMAIAEHTDSDFWIADEESWFASGKQKISPVIEAIKAAEKHNALPAIYLGEKNIMDLKNRIEEWESRGVKIFNNLTDI
ncbi:MAG: hypothetical protein JW985_02155 [Alphaproteobacteria bacterium]|nr:hypothetical protein [Alphaproteobacteria bacterium]